MMRTESRLTTRNNIVPYYYLAHRCQEQVMTLWAK